MSKKQSKIEKLERQVANLQKRAYEAASNGRRVESWKTVNADANVELSGALTNLRTRSRDLYNNAAFARKIIKIWTTSTVGIGIRLSTKETELLSLFKSWSNSPKCDAEGLKLFNLIQQQIATTVFLSGECFVQKVYDKTKKIPLRLRVLEPDFCDHTLTKAKEGLINGIRFNDAGERVSYVFYKHHPGGELASTEKVEVPADDVIHLFNQERPGQVRGVPILSSVMIDLKKLKVFQDARLERQSIANMMTGVISSLDDDPDTPIKLPEFQPGTFVKVSPNSQITFSTPPDPGNTKDFEESQMRTISAGPGSPYELVSGDLSNINFSSLRIGMNPFLTEVESFQENIFIPLALNRIWEWFVDACDLAGLYTKSDEEEYPAATWTTPQKIIVDMKNEMRIKIDMIRAGLISVSEVVRELGYSPEEVFAEIAEEQKLFDDLGLVFESDCRKDASRLKSIQDAQTAQKQQESV